MNDSADTFWITQSAYDTFQKELDEQYPPEHLPAGGCLDGAYELPWPAMWVRGEDGRYVAQLPPITAEWRGTDVSGAPGFSLTWPMVCTEPRKMGVFTLSDD